MALPSFRSPVPSSYFKVHLSRGALSVPPPCPCLVNSFVSLFLKCFETSIFQNRQEIRENHLTNPQVPVTQVVPLRGFSSALFGINEPNRHSPSLALTLRFPEAPLPLAYPFSQHLMYF